MLAPSQFFDTRVALRVFGSFIVAAVLPLGVTAALVFTQVSTTLEDQARASLNEVSSLFGTQMLDRLLIADGVVRDLANGVELTGSLPIDAAQAVENGETISLFGDAFEVPYLVDEDAERSTLTFVGAASETALISRQSGGRTVIGRVDPEYLWDTISLLPYGVTLCVLRIEALDPMLVYCSEDLSSRGRRAILDSASASASGGFIYDDNGDEILARSRELFVQSRFEATRIDIVTTQPRSIALAALGTFNRYLPFVLVGSLILTLLLGSVQIRRIMQPLQALMAGTRRFAKRQFTAAVKLEGDNEFSQLADAMNEMASSLSLQFQTISALAEIDRLILSSQSIDDVLEKVLDRLHAPMPDGYASILLLDPDQTSRAQLFSRTADSPDETEHTRLVLTDATQSWFTSLLVGGEVDPAAIVERLPKLPILNGSNGITIVPVFKGAEIRGALFAQVTSGTLTDDDRGRLYEFASRLAVAVSAADHESELFHRAHFDALTGLPNRQLCFDRLHQAIAQARREEHRLAVLFIDLDRFKNVNDSLGHSQGDELLKEVSLRLAASVRETDTVARLGGDEYVVILPHIEGVVEIETIVAKIFALMRRPFNVAGNEVTITASIGVTVFPDHATDAESLLRKADTAMYAAKDDGRARIEFFEEEMDRCVHERLQLQHDLRVAFKKQQFDLVYQPQLELSNGKLIGIETLLRWHHPERGQVSPAVFVPLLEESGLISDVGRWVIDKALAAAVGWRSEGLQLPRMAVNVSGRQLIEDDFEAFVVDRLGHYGLPGEFLEIELTETSLIEDLDNTNELLRRLADHGIRVAIDDFGTGYSSLGYLQGLQFDMLKIDRAFVQGLPNDKSVAIVEAVLGVARALNKEVVAEGIDTTMQLRKLVDLGCGIGQGFLLSIPIPDDEVLEWSARLDQTSVIEKLIALRQSA